MIATAVCVISKVGIHLFDFFALQCLIDHTGYQGLPISKSALKSFEGKENLTEYRFNTGTAKHWFCRTCGICPLYVPRSNPDGYSVNWRCLSKEGVKSHTLVQRDGQNWEKYFPNHPSNKQNLP